MWPSILLLAPQHKFFCHLACSVQPTPHTVQKILVYMVHQSFKLYTYLLTLQLKKRWVIVSFSRQKAHFVSPFHFLLIKLSFVGITSWCTSHMKILIFSGTCVFHKWELGSLLYELKRDSYIDLTENFPFFSSFQIGRSFLLEKVTANNMSFNFLWSFCSSSDNHLRYVNCRLFSASVDTLICCSLQISYSLGNFSQREKSPHHLSFQKSQLLPFPNFIFLPAKFTWNMSAELIVYKRKSWNVDFFFLNNWAEAQLRAVVIAGRRGLYRSCNML